ncbi:MAG: SCO family protein [Actinomycetota bacterium]
MPARSIMRALCGVMAALIVGCAEPSAGSAAGSPSPSPPPSAAGSASTSPTYSAGHEGAEVPIDPTVSLPSYGYYALRTDDPPNEPDVTLTDQRGKPFPFRDATRGDAVTLLYFGYTNCPDLCPSELGLVASALRNLPDEIADQVRMVFVTVDPARDDIERMKEYVALFDPGFVGLTGDDATIRRMQRSVGLTPATKVPEGNGTYAMRHAAEVLAFTRDGRAHLSFPFGMTLVEWEHDLWKLVEKGWTEP